MEPMRVFRTLALLFCGLAAVGAGAQNATRTESDKNTVSVKQLASEPHHLRQNLERRGYTLQLQFVQDWSKAARASTDSSAGFGRYSVDFSLGLDGEKILGWKGSSGFARIKHHQREFGEGYDAAAQVYSNIDAQSRTTLYELWLQQSLFGGKARFKFGKVDANTEFAVVQTAADFLNSSMGYSPTIVAFPTYPEPKLGFGAFLQPTTRYALNLGVFRTAGMGTLSLVEPQHNWSLGSQERPGRVSIGYWRLDGDVRGFDVRPSTSTQGVYSILEQSLWRRPLAKPEGERRLSMYFQFGMADAKLSPVTHHVGEGMVLQAPFVSRPQDAVGAAATWVRFSTHPSAGFENSAELVLESYYKFTLTRHIALVQDFQFLHHPGGLRANPDCPVITPRLVAVF